MQFSFLEDLDEYFCEKYANYDKLCILDGYEMPVMQATKLDEFGRTYAYTLPAETMRLSLQKNKTELLKQLKTKLTDKSFSAKLRKMLPKMDSPMMMEARPMTMAPRPMLISA